MQRPVLAALLASTLALPAQARWQVSDPPPPPTADQEVWALPGDPVPAPPPPAPAPPPAQVAPQAATDLGAAAGPADDEARLAEQAYYDEQDRLAAQEQAEAEAEAAAEASGYPEIGEPAPRQQRRIRPAVDEDPVWTVQQPYFSLFALGVIRDPDSPATRGNTTALDLGMRFEGKRWGFLVRLGAIGNPDLGTTTFTNLTLEPTFAVVATERFRWRLRGGWGIAGNEAVSMSGLSFGSSMVLCLAGPLDFEADMTAVPFPFTRLDSTAGLALNLGVVSFRTGWRWAYQDDQRHSNGSLQSVRSSGVYGGMGLHF